MACSVLLSSHWTADYETNARFHVCIVLSRANQVDPEVEALCQRLTAAANRKIAPGPDDVGNTGAPFERAVADAFTRLGLIAVRDGRHAAPDVVATAPLGEMDVR